MRLRGRSAREIRFRLAQETVNLARFFKPPRGLAATPGRFPFPDPQTVAERLRGTAFANETLARAERFLRGEIEIFGQPVAVGPQIQWRRDYLSGKETGLDYFRRVPYLNFHRAGDHKVIWEMNRHQHLVALAQAYVLSGERRFLNEVWRQMETWREQNPYGRGINWASALEVAFRALSWLWVRHLAGGEMPEDVVKTLFLHGLYLKNNLSVYFSRNTHLTGEAVALHALGRLFGREEWEKPGARVMDEQLDRQILEDGSYFEQSTYYHVYTLDIFLFYALLRPPNDRYREKLSRMGDYLNALLGPAGKLACFGDDDGGRFFSPYGDRASFGRASVAATAAYLGRSDWPHEPDDLHPMAAWWMAIEDPPRYEPRWGTRIFPDAGMAVMYRDGWQLNLDAGPFGRFPSGHSHADTLSFTLRCPEGEVLIDPGTYTYVADPVARDLFRGTSMHTTIRVDGLDQARPEGPFRWTELPEVRVLRWSGFAIEAECRYRGFTHVRQLNWEKPGRIVIVDEVSGPAGDHVIEQFWHGGECLGKQAILHINGGGEETIPGWRSKIYGSREATQVIRVARTGPLPCRIEAELVLVNGESAA
jgi:hypothetical protein